MFLCHSMCRQEASAGRHYGPCGGASYPRRGGEDTGLVMVEVTGLFLSGAGSSTGGSGG